MVSDLDTEGDYPVAKKKEIHTKVAGVTKRNDEGERIQSLLEELEAYANEGDGLELEHESDNEYDPNAIKVYYEGDHIGYIKRELAAEIVGAVDENRVDAELCEITGGDEVSYGCNILLRILDTPRERSASVVISKPAVAEDLLASAVEFVRSRQTVSVGDLCTGLKINYTLAATVMDKLEENETVGPHRGAQPRKVLIYTPVPGEGAPKPENAKQWASVWMRILSAVLVAFSGFGAVGSIVAGKVVFVLFFIGFMALGIAFFAKSAKTAKAPKSQKEKE